MLFSSPAFFVFFLAYYCLHLILPKWQRIALIIVGSTIFYAWWKVEYVWLPYLLLAIAYGGVWCMARTPEARARRLVTLGTVTVLFVPLVVFKYTDFIWRDVLSPLLGAGGGKLLDLPLPLGVSFVTFTLTAYVVDIYRGRFPAGTRLSTVLAYVLFFPHLIAGPILRPHELIPQLEQPRRARLRRYAVPIGIFSLGLVKKLVLADPIAEAVDAAWQAGAAASGPQALLAIYGFSVQIYCDFSGYTDMAIGLALLLGIRLPNNFLRPYAASSLVEFWRRWHVTLSHWLRDYLYVPLGGSRRGLPREIGNVLITMALGGLWHGANWTFVFWGLYHGLGISSLHLVKRLRGTAQPFGLPRWAGVVLTFHFVTLGWVLFRAQSLGQAWQLLRAVPTGWGDAGGFLAAHLFPVVLVIVALLAHRYDDHRRIYLLARRFRPEFLWPLIALCWMLAITVSQGSSAKFIYFDF